MTPTAEIHAFQTDSKTAVQEPVQFTLRAVLEDGRDIMAQVAHLGGDVNSLLDSTMDTLDRLRARTEIPKLEEKIEEGKDLMAHAEGALARVDLDIDSRIEALKRSHTENDKGYNEKDAELAGDVAEGRTYDREKPGNRQKLQPFILRRKEIEDEVTKLETVREAEHKNFKATQIKHLEDIAKLEKKLIQRQKIVNG